MNYKDVRTNVIGNVDYADGNAGFRDEVKEIFESYTGSGVDLINDLPSIIASSKSKNDFIDALTESMGDSPLHSNPWPLRLRSIGTTSSV